MKLYKMEAENAALTELMKTKLKLLTKWNMTGLTSGENLDLDSI